METQPFEKNERKRWGARPEIGQNNRWNVRTIQGGLWAKRIGARCPLGLRRRASVRLKLVADWHLLDSSDRAIPAIEN